MLPRASNVLRLVDQDQPIAVRDLGSTTHDLYGIAVGSDRGINVDATGLHRGTGLERVHAPFRAAFFAEPARAGTQAQRLVKAAEKELVLQLDHDFGGSDIHPLTMDQKRLAIALEDLLELGRRRVCGGQQWRVS